jgi:hypothetical protein
MGFETSRAVEKILLNLYELGLIHMLFPAILLTIDSKTVLIALKNII